jgi:hypothetical protein
VNHKITAHEPQEELLSSVDEAFQDAEESQKRWEAWEQKHQIKSVRIEVPQAEYAVLQDLARQQGKTVAQFIQAILVGALPALMPPSQAHARM